MVYEGLSRLDNKGLLLVLQTGRMRELWVGIELPGDLSPGQEKALGSDVLFACFLGVPSPQPSLPPTLALFGWIADLNHLREKLCFARSKATSHACYRQVKPNSLLDGPVLSLKCRQLVMTLCVSLLCVSI